VNNPLVSIWLLRVLWRNKRAFLVGAVLPILVIWWVLPAGAASIVFAIAVFGVISVMLLLAVGFFVNIWRGWNGRSGATTAESRSSELTSSRLDRSLYTAGVD
jgi:hypothetical protein